MVFEDLKLNPYTTYKMITEEQILIPLSKNKLMVSLLISVIFVGQGVWFLIFPPQIFSIPILGNIMAIFMILLAPFFFEFVGITVLFKLLSNKAGLIISRQGIVVHSSGISGGLIPWTDLQEIKVAGVLNQKFLVLILNNPQDYLDRVKNSLKRRTMKMNYKSYGSPISISTNALQTDFDSLHRLLVEKMELYKS